MEEELELFDRIDRTPLVATVMDRVRRYIDAEQLAPGARLPSERALREQLNVGRSTVREALRALEALGLVEIRQGSGVFVRAVVSVPPPEEASDDQEERARADWSQLGRVVEARLAIEPFAAGLAAQRRTTDRLRGLEERLTHFDAAAASGDKRSLVMADVDFHAEIADIANPLLAHCLRELGVLLIQSRYISLQRPERRNVVAGRHRAIYQAIASQDMTGAADAMAAHLTDFVHELGYETVGTRRSTHLLEVEVPASLQRQIGSIAPFQISEIGPVDG
jgi:GntR family transcriptional repressor for pyruvate dehydrogenase complex